MFIFYQINLILFKLIAKNRCQRGWSPYHNKCIKFFEKYKEFSEAKKICESNDATLVSIHSEEENNFVYNLVNEKISWIHVWIGGKRNRHNNRFEWINGKAFNYTNWAYDEPNGGYYIGMSGYSGDWYNDGDHNNTFLCEYIRSSF